MIPMPDGYYSRFDSTKNYERHLFRAGYVLQSAELNEIQENALDRARGIADSIFKDGSIVRDCVVVVDEATGETTCGSGAMYLRGAVRGVPPKNFTIPVAGTIVIGVRLVEEVITEVEDVDLKDPAVGLRNYARAGAARLKLSPEWGWDGDGSTANFFPVYTVDNGVLRPKEAPPQIDAVTQAIARYDRDSSGGTYVVNGLTCQTLPDSGGMQVYSVGEGSARVRGSGVTLPTSRRLLVDPTPDLRHVDSEPHVSSGTASQRVTLNLYPVANVTAVTITAEKTVTMTHGAFTGAMDTLPDASVLSIISVSQGATTYVAGTDYNLTGNKVDWSPAGAEPAPGSTYTVTYRYIATVAPDSVDSSGLYVTGAVAGTLILISYNQYLPRIDRICVSDDGLIVFVKGVSASSDPLAPTLPENLLGLATVNQTWDANRSIVNDGVRVVPMQDLAAINSRIDYVLSLVAQQRLESDVHSRESGALKGLFTDPFIDDSQRDAGIAQSGAIFGGVLTLPVAVTATYCDNRPAGSASFFAFSDATVVEQKSRTGSMRINPYSAFTPLPGKATLSPSIDRWVNVQTVWASPVTRLVNRSFSWMRRWRMESETTNEQISSSDRVITNLREIEVSFSVSGFGPNEVLSSVTFDGIAVTATA